MQALYGYDEGQDVDGEFLELSESPPPPARDTVWRTANRATPDALKATPVPVRSSARQREKRLRESEQQLGGRVLNFQDPPPRPTLVTRELEKAFADRDIQRRKNLPPVDPRGHTGVAAGATRAGAARDRRR